MDGNKVHELQSEFLKRLRRIAPVPMPVTPTLLQEIIELDNQLVVYGLGSLGQKIRDFALKIDLQHPEINSIYDGIFADNQDFSQKCIELLLLAKFAKENNLNHIFPSFPQIIIKESFDSNLIKKIDIPQKNKMHVRLLKDCKDREDIRLTKRMQTIDLQVAYKKGREIFDVQPDDFQSFLRFDSAYENDLKVAQKKLNRYKDLGCISLADEIQKSIDVFNEHIKNCYYGFNRITMTNASIILAKSLGYRLNISQDIMTGSQTCRIFVERQFFDKYNFDPEESLAILASDFSEKTFGYEPRVYPLHDLMDLASDEVKQTIDLLDCFPDAGNKPIFDHFGVIVPSVNFPFEQKNNMYTILNETGMVQSYSSREDAIKALDFILIKGKYFYPILVAEKDSKCYFISYWN